MVDVDKSDIRGVGFPKSQSPHGFLNGWMRDKGL